jgi:catechol 2,3-dioxygenase-like lactoylglutathione lyase family enzyme
VLAGVEVGIAGGEAADYGAPMAEATDLRPPVWTGHVVLRSSDPTAAARFYQQIGMRPVQVGEHFAVLEMRGGTHLAIRHDPDHLAPGPASWDLMVDDLDAIHDKWQADGLPVTPVVDGPPHRSFELTDPDGHILTVRDSHVVGPV